MLKFVSLVPKKVRKDYYVIDKIKYIDTDTLDLITEQIKNKPYTFLKEAKTRGNLDKDRLVGAEIFMPMDIVDLNGENALLYVPIDGFGAFSIRNEVLSISSVYTGVTSFSYSLNLLDKYSVRIRAMYIPRTCKVSIEILLSSSEIQKDNNIVLLSRDFAPLNIKSSGKVQYVFDFVIHDEYKFVFDYVPKFMTCVGENKWFIGYLFNEMFQIVYEFTSEEYIPARDIKFIMLCKNSFYSVDTLVIPNTVDYLLYARIYAPDKTSIKNLYICKDKPYTEDFLLNILSSFIDTKYIALLGLDSDKLRDMLLEYINVEFI